MRPSHTLRKWRPLVLSIIGLSILSSGGPHSARAELPPLLCDNLWNVHWFTCDWSDLDIVPLNRDGSPGCGGDEDCIGSPALPGTPGACWSSAITQQQFNVEGAVGWTTGSLGAIHAGSNRDVQVYGDTYLLADTARSLVVPVSATVGSIWLNGALVASHSLPGSVTLSLAA